MVVSSCPFLTSSPVATGWLMISPQAFDFTLNRSTGRIRPWLITVTTTSRRSTGTFS